jgi:hypothetical protein
MINDFLGRFSNPTIFLAISAALSLLGILPDVSQFLGGGAEVIGGFFAAALALVGLFQAQKISAKSRALAAVIDGQQLAVFEAKYNAYKLV